MPTRKPTDRLPKFDAHVTSMAVLVVFVLVLLVQRCFDGLVWPILYNEDGRQMVAWFVNNPEPAQILRQYAGYKSLLPNLLGWLSVRILPLPLVPYAFGAFAVGLATWALTLFASRRFRFLVPSDRTRIAACLVAALAPLGNHALLSTLTFSIWNAYIVTFLLLVAPLPASRWARVAQFVFMGLVIWSNPYSVLFGPVCLLLLWLRRTPADRVFLGGLLVVTVSYWALGIDKSFVSPQVDASVFVSAFAAIEQRVVFESIFGNALRMTLREGQVAWVVHLVAAAVLGAVAILAWRERKSEAAGRVAIALGVLAYLFVSMSWIAVFGRVYFYEDLLAIPWGQRYFLPQQLLFLLLVVSLVGMNLEDRVPAAVKAAVVVVVAGCAVGLNVQHRPYFETSREEGRIVARFLADAQERLDGPRPRLGEPRQIILNRGDEWNIIIEIPMGRGTGRQ